MTIPVRSSKRPWLIFAAFSVLLCTTIALRGDDKKDDKEKEEGKRATTLYIWAGDQARKAPDFLAVVNFDENSKDYGEVIKTVPIPPPGNTGNEPHHCHLSADKRILACGGLLS